MKKSMKENLDELYIASLENLVDKQKEVIEAYKKELEMCHGLIDKLCDYVGIDAPKWKG